MASERKKNAVVPENTKHGDIMAIVKYVRVDNSLHFGERLEVSDIDNGLSRIEVSGKELVRKMLSADQFKEEVKVSMTELATMLVESWNRPLTVHFIKENGEPRILRGRLLKTEPLFGKSMLEDLDELIAGKAGFRWVMHHNLKSLIVDGIKYIVK